VSVPGLGFSTRSIVAALVALGIPPVMTNAYLGVRGVDPDVIEAARGMGLSGTGILRRIELPLAAPVIMAGVRTAAVQIVATATLAAVIQGGGLGRFIVDGFSVGDNTSVLAGALFVALLAILTEVGFGGIERLVTPAGLALERRRSDDHREE
jgi:osmoprotectant transport system permease protein